MTSLSELLTAASAGDPQAAAAILPLVYTELKQLATAKIALEQATSLNATDLVHEAYLRLLGTPQYYGHGHFFAAAAEAMRRILVDQARVRHSIKRGARWKRVPISDEIETTADEELLALHEALLLLEVKHPDHALLVKLRYFAGLTADEAAATLDISPSTADRRWTFARAWLRNAIQ